MSREASADPSPKAVAPDPPPGARSRPSARLALVVLFVLVYLAPLGARPLFLPDEFRYAEIPREMIASGDWVVPRFDGFLYFEKPVLGYWLTAVSMRVLGLHRFAIRLPSALSLGLTALLCSWLVVRTGEGRGRAAAPLAAFILLTTPLVLALGSVAVLDGPLTLFLTGALGLFFWATTAEAGSAAERGRLLLSGASCGLAFLTKGFLVFAVIGLVTLSYLAWQRRWRDLLRLPWWPALGTAVVAAPWSLLVHHRAPEFWPFFFWHEHVQRFLHPVAEQHPSPWWLLLAVTPVLFLPWTLVAPSALSGWRELAGGGARDLVRFCLAWSGGVYLFFSVSSGKIITYVLPAFPPLAILLALGLARRPAPRFARWNRLAALLGAGASFLLAAGGVVYLARTPGPVFASPLRAAVLPSAFALGAVLLALAARTGSTDRRLVLLGLSLVPFFVGLQLALPVRVLDSKAPGEFLARHRDEVSPETIVVADSNTVRAASWVFGRADILLAGSLGELEYGASRAPERVLDLDELRELLEREAGRVVVVVEDKSSWREELPAPVAEDRAGQRKGYLLRRY